MTEDRPWLGEEPTGRPDLRFSPGATGVGVFFGVAGLIAGLAIILGSRQQNRPYVWLIVVGIIAGIVAGTLVGMWLSAPARQRPRRQL